MDVWLPDLKFGPGKCAVTLSRTPWYWETVTGNIQTIHHPKSSQAMRIKAVARAHPGATILIVIG